MDSFHIKKTLISPLSEQFYDVIENYYLAKKLWLNNDKLTIINEQIDDVIFSFAVYGKIYFND